MMKLSAHSESPNFIADLIGRNRVLLNGEEVTHCTFADEEEGFVIVTKLDDQGDIVTNGDYIVYEKKEGKVQIIDLRPQ